MNFNDKQLDIWEELLLCGEVIIHDKEQEIFQEVLEQSEKRGYIIVNIQSNDYETIYRLISTPYNERFFADKLVYSGIILE